MSFFFGDVRDIGSVQNAVKDCEFIFHLAVLISIPYSYLAPLSYLRTNVEGTLNILDTGKKRQYPLSISFKFILLAIPINFFFINSTPLSYGQLLTMFCVIKL